MISQIVSCRRVETNAFNVAEGSDIDKNQTELLMVAE